jgi:hypothetical protein
MHRLSSTVPLALLLGVCAATAPARAQVTFESSNLPILVVDTDGEEIPDEPRIDAHLGVIDNGPGRRNALGDPFNGYDGLIGIEIRGSSSQTFPKKGYAVETRNPDRSNNNVPLLGMPSENDWVLHGPYSDKSLMRNALAYDLARSTGRYASRVRFCELVLNGDYRGVYAVLEKIKRDDDRVDIARLRSEETEGDDLTGGYIFKVDKDSGGQVGGWFSAYSRNGIPVEYRYHDPNGQELVPEQEAYIQNYMRGIEDVLMGERLGDPETGYASVLDVGSFVDYLLVNELVDNTDAYRSSAYFHKDKDSNDPRLVMGPVWDFNLSLGNPVYYENHLLVLIEPSPDTYWPVPPWWPRLAQEPTFAETTAARWSELRRGAFHRDSLDARITQYADLLGEAQARNFERWPVLGTYVWPNSFVSDSWEEEVEYLREWLHNRAEWLDGAFASLIVAAEEGPTSEARGVRVYPNPTLGAAWVEVDGGTPREVVVYDALGRLVSALHSGGAGAAPDRFRLETGALPVGGYHVVVRWPDGKRDHRWLTVAR